MIMVIMIMTMTATTTTTLMSSPTAIMIIRPYIVIFNQSRMFKHKYEYMSCLFVPCKSVAFKLCLLGIDVTSTNLFSELNL